MFVWSLRRSKFLCSVCFRTNPFLPPPAAAFLSSKAAEFYVPHIPENELEFRFSRSSGPGGQNVNKLNTKAEIRFNIEDAHWLNETIKKRLRELYAPRITKHDELLVTSQVHRTQEQNRQDALARLRQMVVEAARPVKERKQREGLTAQAKENRLRNKKMQSSKKAARGKGDF